ncbi:hypothetical protein E3Q23_01325 [Wallemia mellicola]|uniref:Cloroperoxidase n=1 Tax=Wallemia mellicola TaxID=1708541 RepID=A0A4T0PPS0_9BASI|nr:hypothetical protein E3Q24_01610 [Wallemia mellicola]TIB77358.1 hypothetical protein E3Q23_01325 [Wallemia mellicola]TIC13021.1 Cloroperoxidase [Wallemia mellicola]TIC24512.1 Cloroperoxidase [Wallemia mellicola]TIC29684.1 Cloroperoxidase [Wallemia mellicola]
MVNFAKALLGACALVSTTSAFPAFDGEWEKFYFENFDKAIDPILKRIDQESWNKIAAIEKRQQATFNEDAQRVDVSGEHEYRPPTEGQTRGPCPGLNILSNHGYFDRSGNTNLIESIDALTNVLGMGTDTALALVAYSIAIIGDPIALTWSIGASPGKEVLLPGVLSPPGGIDQSHNSYESDASITRSDSYLSNGDVWSSNTTRFEHLYNLLDDNDPNANFNLDVINKQRAWTHDESVYHNPNFFMRHLQDWSLHLLHTISAEHPEGYLDHYNLKTFFGYTGNSKDGLVYHYGQERIPDNWYKRTDPYTLVDVVTDVLGNIAYHPQAGTVGGNLGEVNTFTGVDLGNLTGGVFNAANLLEGNNLFCFAFAAGRAGLPSVLGGAASIVGQALGFLDEKLGPILAGLSCPELDQLNLDVFNQFPGYG